MIADDGVDSIDDVFFRHDAVAQQRMNDIGVSYVAIHRLLRLFDNLRRCQGGIRQLKKLRCVFIDESIEMLTLFFFLATPGLEEEKRWIKAQAMCDVIASTSSWRRASATIDR